MLTKIRRQLQNLKWSYRELKHQKLLTSHPKVFCNSFHKSGSQLLVTATAGITGIQHYDRSVFNHFLTQSHVDEQYNTDYQSALRQLNKLLPGELLGGHVEYNASLDHFMSESGIKQLLVIRDLRDVVVSNLNWWHNHKEINIWPYCFFKDLPNDDERLLFLILGEEYEGIRHMNHYDRMCFPNVVARFETFLPWLSSHNCLTLTFEELKLRPEDTFEKLYTWVWDGKDPTSDEIVSMRQNTKPENSKTYFKSLVNQWPHYFKEKHHNAFERIGGFDIANYINILKKFN
jgi:hypothetical protein